MDISAFVRLRSLRNAFINAGQPADEASSLCGRIALTLMCEVNGFFLGKPFTALLIHTPAPELSEQVAAFWRGLSFLPQFNENSSLRADEAVRQRLIDVAAVNWSSISPDLLGSFYEYALSREQQNDGGVFYTSKDNVHRVIDNLFIDELYEQLEAAYGNREQLENFGRKLCSLTFLDAACGGGNFLTETLAFLRSIETEMILSMRDAGTVPDCYIDYNKQIFGIEYDSRSAAYARAALMVQNRISDIKQAAQLEGALRPVLYPENTIAVGDSLLINWRGVVGDRISYVIGNPPFVYQKSREQLEGMEAIFDEGIDCSSLDYCAAWVRKASYLCDSGTKCAFLTTSSICQGEQVAPLWENISRDGIKIDFAYRPYIWVSDIDQFSEVDVQTYCTIIGFSSASEGVRKLHELTGTADNVQIVQNISGYLEDMPDIYIKPSDVPLNGMPPLSRTTTYPDYLTEMEYRRRLSQGASENNFLPYLHGKKTLYGEQLYYEVTSEEQRTPHNYIAMSRTSSIKRSYLPIMYFENTALIANEGVFLATPATLYQFGLLCSTMHTVWTKLLSGRLANNLRYSIRIAYNTFPVPEATEEEQKVIADLAAQILQLRSAQSKCLAELYDHMPIALRTAHSKLDYYVDKLYSSTVFTSRKQRLDILLGLYLEQTENRNSR